MAQWAKGLHGKYEDQSLYSSVHVNAGWAQWPTSNSNFRRQLGYTQSKLNSQICPALGSSERSCLNTQAESNKEDKDRTPTYIYKHAYDMHKPTATLPQKSVILS